MEKVLSPQKPTITLSAYQRKCIQSILKGGVSSTTNQLLLPGSSHFAKCQNQPFFAQIRAFDICKSNYQDRRSM